MFLIIIDNHTRPPPLPPVDRRRLRKPDRHPDNIADRNSGGGALSPFIWRKKAAFLEHKQKEGTRLGRTDERFREAYNSLLDYCGTLGPGESLPAELLLSSHLQVSRTIVRSALERMHDQAIIHWSGRAKTLLRPPRPEDRLETQAGAISEEELERQFLDWILRADIPPETALNVTELSRRFQVPAYAFQEFLASLSRFGLVRRRQRGGWEMVGFTRDFAVELSDFRTILELNAVSHLVGLPPDHPVWSELVALRTEHQRLENRIDHHFNDFSQLDERFHTTIGAVVRNRFTAEFGKVISLIFHYHFQWDKSDERDRNHAAIAEHLAIIAALEARDKEAALAAAQRHLRTSKQTLLASLRLHESG